MRRALAALALGSVLVLYGCGASDDAEELTTRAETTSASTTTSATSSTTTTTTVARTAATRPPATTSPQPAPAPEPLSGNCSPAYPDFCIPPSPPDLDCPDVSGKRFTVLSPDLHGFDGNDDDGIGCES